MAETGHARNCQRFAELISFCEGYGAVYQPQNHALSVADLQTLLAAGQDGIDGVTTAMGPWKNAVSERREAFRGLRPLTTRVINAFAVSGAPQSAVDQAESFKRKIDGERAKQVEDDPSTPENEAENTISVSQQSYTQLVEHLDNLIQVLTDSGQYNPAETDLKLLALNTLSTALKAANQAVIDTNTPFSNARIARNDALYAEGTGLVDIAGMVKKYVKALFGADSPQFAQVSGLEFTRPREH
jgi:hypothetical protein